MAIAVVSLLILQAVLVLGIDVSLSPSKLELLKGETRSIHLSSDNDTMSIFTVTFSDNNKIYRLLNASVTVINGTAEVWVLGLSIGSEYLNITNCTFANGSSCEQMISANDVYSTISVIHAYWISHVSDVVGWIYFVAWSISFYPQIILNFRRKSVVGLNFDFLLLNVVGFTCYTIFNVVLFFNASVQKIYEKQHPRSHIPVELNDVVFAIHAIAACLFTSAQCLFLERRGQRISYTCMVIVTIFVLYSLSCLGVTLFHVVDWLMFINMLSYVKMAVTLLKYCPQAFMNFKLKSTVGWSIGNVLLDLTGGLMSLLQMGLDVYNTGDWYIAIGNPVKFGLSFVSIVFDALFIVQHYVLYRHNNPYDEEGIDNIGAEYSPEDMVNTQYGSIDADDE